MSNALTIICVLGGVTSVALALQATWLSRPRYRRRGEAPVTDNGWQANRGAHATVVPVAFPDPVDSPKLSTGR